MGTTNEGRDELSDILESLEARERMGMSNDGSSCDSEAGLHEDHIHFEGDGGTNTSSNSNCSSFIKARETLVNSSKPKKSDWVEDQINNKCHDHSGDFMKAATHLTLNSSLSLSSSATSSSPVSVVTDFGYDHTTNDTGKKKPGQKKKYLSTLTTIAGESGVHNRLYARSQAKQAEGKEKREQIAMSLSRKPIKPTKKISAKEASSLFDRLYVDGVQKQISLGRKKDVPSPEKIIPPEYKKTMSSPIISTTQANVLYNRLYSEAMTKKIKETASNEDDKPKVKVKAISSQEAHSLYQRLYCGKALTLHKARFSEKT